MEESTKAKRPFKLLVLIFFIFVFLIILLITFVFHILQKDQREFYNTVKIKINNSSQKDYFIRIVPIDLSTSNQFITCSQDRFIIPHRAATGEKEIFAYCGDYPDFKNLAIGVIGWNNTRDSTGNYSKISYEKPEFMYVFYKPEWDFRYKRYSYDYFTEISVSQTTVIVIK